MSRGAIVRCRECGSANLEAHPVAPNATGRAEDQEHAIEVVCLDCGAKFIRDARSFPAGSIVGQKRVIER